MEVKTMKMDETIITSLIGILALILIRIVWTLTDPQLFWEKLAVIHTGSILTFIIYLIIKYDIKRKYEQ